MAGNQSDNPLQCTARSKRSGKRCRNFRTKGYRVCRMHGARGGAPKGNKNAVTSGRYTAEAKARRSETRALIRLGRQLAAEMAEQADVT